MNRIEEAYSLIVESGLDRIRCCLTGAPYATLDEHEIKTALRGDLESEPESTIERLIDRWELRALSFNSQPLPSLRSATPKTLLPMLRDGHNGQVKILTYLLSRLFYPHVGTDPMPSGKAIDRMLFASQAYDTISKWEYSHVAGLVQQLVAVDAFCAMPYWHKMWVFESAYSPVGIAKAKASVKEAFVDPASVLGDYYGRVKDVIEFMFQLMIAASENDSAIGIPGNSFAKPLLHLQASVVPLPRIPQHQKRELSEAEIARIKNRKTINNSPELRIAWSAIHGKNTLPSKPKLTIKAEGKLTPAPKKAKSEKPKDKLTQLMEQTYARLKPSLMNLDLTKLQSTDEKK
jgi:hypothetical protein